MSPPDASETVRIVKQIYDDTINLEQWEQVPFPSPLDSYFDYVYTIDRDASIFTLSKWSDVDDVRMPVALEASLAEIYEASTIFEEFWHQKPRFQHPDSEGHCDPQLNSVNLKPWNLPTEFPTAMVELQQQFFIDFMFLWRSWIDDPMTWHYGSRVFNAISRAILRLAAWDFEVSYDCDVHLPINHSSIPSWHFPEDTCYWFHGFLIMLQPDLESPQSLCTAVTRAKAFINVSSRTPHQVRSILISPRHVAFVKVSQHAAACSEVFPLLADSSATHCSPGFRALAQVLTSDFGRTTNAHREKWLFSIPPEILSKILQLSEPRDAVSFAQASFEAERSYYASVPQFRNVSVQSLGQSIPCCGDRTGLEDSGMNCSRCRIWQHQTCLGLETLPPRNSFLCAACLENDPKAMRLTPGGINRLGGRVERRKHPVTVNGSARALQLRRSKPAHLRPELRLVGSLIHDIPKGLVDFTIRFNGVFTGLAYGLDTYE